MLKDTWEASDEEFAVSALEDGGEPSKAPSAAPAEQPVEALAGGVPGDFAPDLAMAGGVPSLEEPGAAPAASLPALITGEDPVEANRQRILRRKFWERLLTPSFWDTAKATLLRKAEDGGLRTDVGISGDVVTFAIKGSGLTGLIRPPKIEFDLAKGRLSASGFGLSAQALAAAYIECGLAAGYKQMWFQGSPDFVRAATEMAKAAGIEVISKKECAALRALRKLEHDAPAAAPDAPVSAAPEYDAVDEEMATRVFNP